MRFCWPFHFLLSRMIPCRLPRNKRRGSKSKTNLRRFLSQTFTIRMQYEYSGRFLNRQDKETLLKAAQQASADLEQIANTQLAMKQAIELYQKDDWETLFGQTGLWRKLAADLLITNRQTRNRLLSRTDNRQPRNRTTAFQNISQIRFKPLCSPQGLTRKNKISWPIRTKRA